MSKEIKNQMESDRRNRVIRPSGYYANRSITQRNGGIRHQFTDSIGGCSSNYK